MTTLTIGELAKIRQRCATNIVGIDYIKIDINSAVQAIEDWIEVNMTNLMTAIDSATIYNFTNAQKNKILKFWLNMRFNR